MRSINLYIKSQQKVKTTGLIAIILILVFTCSACFKNAEVPALAVETPKTTQEAQTTEKNVLPKEGGELLLPMAKNPDTNPLKVKNMYMANIYSLMFESLVTIDLEGRVQPCLAETWEIGPNQKEWVFHLRKGIQWQNGSGELKASDVKFTIDKLKELGDTDTIYSNIKKIVVNSEVVNDNTIKIFSDKPMGELLYAMVFPILPEKYYVDAAGLDANQPVGTGPYKLDKYSDTGSDKGMWLSINDKWWKKRPYIQKIHAIPVDNNDNDVELAGYQSGIYNYVTTAILTSGKYRQTGKTTVTDYLTQYYDCLVPNLNKPVLSDVNVRKAIAYAIDKGDIISRALLNHAEATDFPIPSGSWLYEGKLKMYEYNVPKAKELLEGAGWKDTDGDKILEKEINGNIEKLKFKLLILKTADITYRIDVAKLIQGQLREVGIEVEEIKEEEETKVKNEKEDNTKSDITTYYLDDLKSGNFDMALCSFWMGRYPDLSSLLQTNGTDNYAGYKNTKMDEALANFAAQEKPDDMKKAFGDLQQAFVDDLPHVALYFRTNSAVYDSSKIKGVGKVRELNIYNDISKWYIETKPAE